MPKARTIALQGDVSYCEAVTFQMNDDGSLRIWIDGGEGGDTEAGFYGIEAERTFAPKEVEKLLTFLTSSGSRRPSA